MGDLPRRTYTLFLNTNTGFPNLTSNESTANVKWFVNWDALFSGDNYKYKNCSVRMHLVGEKNVTQETSAISGVLVANFGQAFSGKNIPGVVLAPIELTRSIDSSVTSNTGGYIQINTLANAFGQNINMPVGANEFNLQMWRNGYGSNGDAENILVTNTVPYYVIFQFELYN